MPTLYEAIAAKGLRKGWFAAQMGWSRPTLASYNRDPGKIRTADMAKVCKELGLEFKSGIFSPPSES